jgi:hypothetical protein
VSSATGDERLVITDIIEALMAQQSTTASPFPVPLLELEPIDVTVSIPVPFDVEPLAPLPDFVEQAAEAEATEPPAAKVPVPRPAVDDEVADDLAHDAIDDAEAAAAEAEAAWVDKPSLLRELQGLGQA